MRIWPAPASSPRGSFKLASGPGAEPAITNWHGARTSGISKEVPGRGTSPGDSNYMKNYDPGSPISAMSTRRTGGAGSGRPVAASCRSPPLPSRTRLARCPAARSRTPGPLATRTENQPLQGGLGAHHLLYPSMYPWSSGQSRVARAPDCRRPRGYVAWRPQATRRGNLACIPPCRR